jgi:hypothetical protein
VEGAGQEIKKAQTQRVLAKTEALYVANAFGEVAELEYEKPIVFLDVFLSLTYIWSCGCQHVPHMTRGLYYLIHRYLHQKL